MDICIFGAGAIGITIGTRLAARGHRVSAVARGATLGALNAHGLRLIDGAAMRCHAIQASRDPADLGVQDIVFISVKGPALAAVAALIAPLIGPHTQVVTAMNGVPWWFFDGMEGPLAGASLASIDAEGALRQQIPSRHVTGCVVHLAASVVEPGKARINFGNRLILGEPDHADSPRLGMLVEELTAAGFDAESSLHIQRDIWFKLWGNMTMNPISALTGATCDRILDDPLVNDFCAAVMGEAAAIGTKIGCPITQTAQERNALTRKLGAFKTSMLQDAEAGRTLEIDALLTVVHEIAGRIGIAIPNTAALLGLVRVFAKQNGL
ncbi:MAG: 2-dehydropantoate 2-reductase [Proteobacteria bacterium]|nr:2-dehydropantoate 2-reductase [Pseudomonadota bacterium]